MAGIKVALQMMQRECRYWHEGVRFVIQAFWHQVIMGWIQELANFGIPTSGPVPKAEQVWADTPHEMKGCQAVAWCLDGTAWWACINTDGLNMLQNWRGGNCCIQKFAIDAAYWCLVSVSRPSKNSGLSDETSLEQRNKAPFRTACTIVERQKGSALWPAKAEPRHRTYADAPGKKSIFFSAPCRIRSTETRGAFIGCDDSFCVGVPGSRTSFQ